MTGTRTPAAPPAEWRGRLRLRGLAVPLVLLALLASGGCGEEEPPRASDGEGAVAAEEPRLYTSPDDFEPAFTTVLPEDVRPELPEVEEGEADVIRFFSYAGGERHDSAFVQVFVWPTGQSADAAEEVVRTAAERVRIPGDRTELEPIRRHPWAAIEYEIQSVGTAGEPVMGWVALGWHGGRWFYILAQAPERLHRTFLPKAETILERWRWRDTGRGLEDALPPSVTQLP